jgi:hypothetical protein
VKNLPLISIINNSKKVKEEIKKILKDNISVMIPKKYFQYNNE